MRCVVCAVRNDECRGPASGWARLPDALPSWLPAVTVRDHAGVLAQGRDGTADVRDSPVETGRVLYAVWKRIHGLVRASQINSMHSAYVDALWVICCVLVIMQIWDLTAVVVKKTHCECHVRGTRASSSVVHNVSHRVMPALDRLSRVLRRSRENWQKYDYALQHKSLLTCRFSCVTDLASIGCKNFFPGANCRSDY